MRITVKLFASLASYLPPGSTGNEARMEVEDDIAVDALLTRLHVPAVQCHLVLVNGTYIAPRDRSEVVLRGDDEVAVWPQVAGGEGRIVALRP